MLQYSYIAFLAIVLALKILTHTGHYIIALLLYFMAIRVRPLALSLSVGTSATDTFDIRLKGEYHIYTYTRILRRCASQRVCISSAISLIFYIIKFTRRRQMSLSNPVIYEYFAFVSYFKIIYTVIILNNQFRMN